MSRFVNITHRTVNFEPYAYAIEFIIVYFSLEFGSKNCRDFEFLPRGMAEVVVPRLTIDVRIDDKY